MKKIIIFLLIIMPLNVKGISASSYIVMDMDNNYVLEGSMVNSKRLIASTSKIMTAIIAIENGKLDDIITVDKSILSAVGSSIYLEIGEKISLKDLLYGMMLRSGNDAATMIAVHISGSMDKFAKLMNDYALKLGMKDSYFYNAHGLENNDGNGNISTCYDMALLTSYAFKNKTFKEIFGTKNYNAKSSKKSYNWLNKNKLLKYDYITGGKTGYTMKAKRTLVTTGYINNKNIVIVTLNDPNDWNDHINLYQKVQNEYQKINVLNKKKFKILDDVVFIEDKLYIKNDYSILLKKSDINKLSIKYYLENKKYKDGDIIGKVRVYYDNKEVYNDNVYIKKTSKNKIKNFFNK